MHFTVFTPTYNRGYIIEHLYHSLQQQSFRDFEWIVVDDGSTDDTQEKMKGFIEENNFFPIIYCKVPNGGKHRAINIGVKRAQGELFFIVDSDDYLTNDALKIVAEIEESIPQKEKSRFAGVCGQKGYDVKTAVGSTFPDDIIDITSLERTQNGITGDKAEVFYTDILRKYPFPEFEGENFITECTVWDKIAYDGYKLRFFNKIIYICDYLPDGLTAKGQSLFLKNPKGYGLYLSQCSKYGKIKGIEKWNAYLKYYYSFRNQYSNCAIARNLCTNPIVFWFRIFGLRLFYKLYSR